MVVNPMHQVARELHVARLHLLELDQALESYTRAGWLDNGNMLQKSAWETLSKNRETQALKVAELETEERNLLR